MESKSFNLVFLGKNTTSVIGLSFFRVTKQISCTACYTLGKLRNLLNYSCKNLKEVSIIKTQRWKRENMMMIIIMMIMMMMERMEMKKQTNMNML